MSLWRHLIFKYGWWKKRKQILNFKCVFSKWHCLAIDSVGKGFHLMHWRWGRRKWEKGRRGPIRRWKEDISTLYFSDVQEFSFFFFYKGNLIVEFQLKCRRDRDRPRSSPQFCPARLSARGPRRTRPPGDVLRVTRPIFHVSWISRPLHARPTPGLPLLQRRHFPWLHSRYSLHRRPPSAKTLTTQPNRFYFSKRLAV